jgi:phage terminase large subunit GpA-like protein
VSDFTFVGRRTKKIFEWKPFIGMEEWFESNINLTKGARKGMFQTKYAPHLREIFADIDRSNVNIVTVKSSSQIQKTTLALGFIMKQIDTDPNDCMIMVPRDNEMKVYSENKLKPMIDGCESVKNKLMDYKISEKTRDNSFVYRFAGGLLNFLSSNKTKTISIKYAVFDEVAEFTRGKVGEALERMKSYGKSNWKALVISTQNTKNDEINHYFNTSEVKKQYFMYCPNCDGYYYPEIENLKYKSKSEYMASIGVETLSDYEVISEYLPVASRSARLQCPHCQHEIDENDRENIILEDKLKWFQVAPKKLEDGEITYERVEKEKTEYKTVGFDVNTFCSYNVPLGELVEKIIKAEHSEDIDIEMDYFYKGYLNKIYKPVQASKIEANDLFMLNNNLSEFVIPKDTIKVYMAVDTQKDHFWVEVKAFEYGLVSHTIYNARVETFSDIEDIWEKGQYLKTEDGRDIRISSMAIDRRGYNQDGVRRTDEVDAFVAYMVSKWKNGDDYRIYASEGQSALTGDLPIQIGHYRDNSNNKHKLDMKILKISNVYLKGILFRAIDRTIAKIRDKEENNTILFYMNNDLITRDMQDDTGLSYVSQITAETYSEKKGTYIKIRRNNHYLDTSVICYALAEKDKIMLERKTESSETLYKTFQEMLDFQ